MPAHRRATKPPPETFVDMAFPIAGVDSSDAFGRQRPRTTPLGQNVRARDPVTFRSRGAQRPGLQKYVSGQVSGSNRVQELQQLTVTSGAIPGSGTTVLLTAYTPPGHVVIGSHTYATSFLEGTRSLAVLAQSDGAVAAWVDNCNRIVKIAKNGSTTSRPIFATHKSGGFFTFQDFTVSLATDGTNFYAVAVSTEGGGTLLATGFSPSGTMLWETTPGAATSPSNGTGTGIVVSGGILYAVVNTNGVLQIDAATGAANSPYILCSAAAIAAAAPGYAIDGYGVDSSVGNTPARTHQAVAIAGNIIAVPIRLGTYVSRGIAFINKTTGALSPSPLTGLAAENTVNTRAVCDLCTDGTNFYLFVPKNNASYVVKVNGLTGAIIWTSATIAGIIDTYGSSYSIAYDASVAGVYVSTVNASLLLNPTTGAITGGGLGSQIGSIYAAGLATVNAALAGDQINYNRAIVLLGVSAGDVKVAYNGAWRSVTNGTAALSTTASVVRSAVNLGKVWFADGTHFKYYDPATNTVLAWTASAGQLPCDGEGHAPRLICTWRGRTVVSGLRLDPSNWFMSAVGDPRDFDYSPAAQSATQAVAGNNSTLGLVGDVVTALVPYSDDVLLFGGDHTLWRLSGDPLAGGQLDRISDSIGMAWGIPWTMDPTGAIYFMSNLGSIYTLAPGEAPTRVSGPIDSDLMRIPMDQVIVRLLWDEVARGLHVFVTPYLVQSAATHFFWEQQTGAWWQDVFANDAHNPCCCLAFQGNLATDRVGLIGSWDGYVRAFQDAAPSDDGTEIDSAVLIGPLLTKDLDEVLVKDLQAILATGSSSVSYAVLAGDTPERAITSTAVTSGTWSAGRNLSTFIRRAAHALYVRLDGTAPWAMETIRARVTGLGKVRRRGG